MKNIILFLFTLFLGNLLFSQSYRVENNSLTLIFNIDDGSMPDSIIKEILADERIKRCNILNIVNAYHCLPEFITNLNWVTDVNVGGVYHANNFQSIQPNFILANEFNGFDKLNTLNLYSVGIKEIHHSFKCKNLKILTIKNDVLREIPRAIFNCSNLIELNLARNRISNIHSEIYSLKKLRSISLMLNDIEVLPNELFMLPLLQTIYLDGNNISILPDLVCELERLEELSVTGNPIFIIPECITQMQNLLKFGIDIEGKSFGYE